MRVRTGHAPGDWDDKGSASALTEVQRDMVAYEEMRLRGGDIGADADDIMGGDLEEGFQLLNIATAYEKEALRMKRAGPRRRVTADDLP